MKILVVDDERDVQALFEQRFRKEIRLGEMKFIFAFSGEDALAYLYEHEHEAVLILSDINMPGMSGLDLQKWLIEEGHRIPVIFLTGFPDENVRSRALKAGALAFLSKPLDHRDLVDHLEKTLK